MSYLDEKDNKIKGFAVDLVEAILVVAELEYKTTVLPWIRAFKKAEINSNIIIFPMGRTANREEKFKWIGEIIPISYNLYCLTENCPTPSLTIEQIRKEPVAVPRNDLRAAYLKETNFTNLILTSGNQQTEKFDTGLEIALSRDTSNDIFNKLKKSYINIRNNGKYLEIMKPLYKQLNYTLPEK